MGFNPLDLIKYAALLRYVPDVIKAIQAVETLFRKPQPDMPKEAWDQARQDAAIAMVMQFLGLSEKVADRDLLNDATVESLMRQLINVLIAIDNAIRDFRTLKPQPTV